MIMFVSYVNVQVKLQEYVKIDDALYEINTSALAVEDCITFTKQLGFKVDSHC